MLQNKLYYILFFSIIALSCNKNEVNNTAPSNMVYSYNTPSYFPEYVLPENNKPTEARVKLGELLFFDTRLSVDKTVSCASCHIPSKAFSDDRDLSIGVNNKKGFRNSPPLFNLLFSPYFFMDGGIPKLELQVLAPIEDSLEMNFHILDVANRLNEDEDLVPLFLEAYNEEPNVSSITKAIAAFERTLISGNSAFDQYYYQNIETAISEKAKKGFQLFDSLECTVCHELPLFTNFEFHNIGLKQNYSNDLGRMRITLNTSDEGEFKVPTLRNISLTAPYFHDGSISTLEEALDIMLSGGEQHPNLSVKLKKHEVTQTEKEALLEFLNTLTDNEFANSFNDPLRP